MSSSYFLTHTLGGLEVECFVWENADSKLTIVL